MKTVISILLLAALSGTCSPSPLRSRPSRSSFLVARSSLLSASQVAKTITFTAKAARLRILLAELSKSAGVSLKPAPETGDDVMVLKLNGVTVNQAMDRIAQVEVAQWKLDHGAYYLTRSRALAEKQAEQDIEVKTAVVRRSLMEMGQKAIATPLLDSAGAQRLVQDIAELSKFSRAGRPVPIDKVRERHPVVRTLRALIALLDPKLLAMNDGNRLVFSSAPTRTQLPLPAGAPAILTELIQEEALITYASKSLSEDQRTLWWDFYDKYLVTGNPSQVAKTLLVVKNEPSYERNFELHVYDAEGKDILRSQEQENVVRNTDPPPEIKTTAEPVDFSALTQELTQKSLSRDFVGGYSSDVSSADSQGQLSVKLKHNTPNSKRAISPELKTFLLNPEKADPLSAAPSELFLAIADQNQANLVALLPDTCVSTYNRLASKRSSTAAAVKDKYFLGRINFKVENGWFLITPKLPSFERREAVSRTTLGTLARGVEEDGEITLNNLLAFARAEVMPLPDCYLARMYAQLLNRSPADSERYPDWRVLRFLGSLSGPQFDLLSKSAPLHISQLSQDQSELLSTWYYNSSKQPDVNPMAPRPPGDLKFERTESCPDGLPTDGSFKMETVSEPCAIGIEAATGFRELLDIPTLANYRFQSVNDEARNHFGAPPTFDTYTPAQQMTYKFHFLFTPTVWADAQLHAVSVAREARPVAYDALPQGMRDRADTLFARISKLFAGLTFGQPTSGAIRPPP